MTHAMCAELEVQFKCLTLKELGSYTESLMVVLRTCIQFAEGLILVEIAIVATYMFFFVFFS